MAKKKLYYDAVDIKITSMYVKIKGKEYPLQEISSAGFTEHKKKIKTTNYKRYIKDGMLYLGITIIGLGVLSSSTPVDFSFPVFKDILPFLGAGGILLVASFFYNAELPEKRKKTTGSTYRLKLNIARDSAAIHLPIHTTTELKDLYSTKDRAEIISIINAINQALEEFSAKKNKALG